jgi:hypothetical protein
MSLKRMTDLTSVVIVVLSLLSIHTLSPRFSLERLPVARPPCKASLLALTRHMLAQLPLVGVVAMALGVVMA